MMKTMQAWPRQHTGIFGIIFQFTDTLKEPQHHTIHLGTCLTRISNKQHRFQHWSTASRRKLHTHTQYRCGTTRYLVIQRTVRDDLLLSGAKHGPAFSFDHSDDYKIKHNTTKNHDKNLSTSAQREATKTEA